MDKIIIDDLECFAHHGVFAKEKEKGQLFLVSVVLYTDTVMAGKTDDLNCATNYGEVCAKIHSWMQENTCDLIEKVAEEIAALILKDFPLVKEVDVEIKKPNAPIGLPFGNVSVKIHRGWSRVYLAVGSNMGDKEAYIQGAIENLRAREDIKNVVPSDLLVTKPYGGVEQDDFLNGAIAIDTMLSPRDLLTVLHEIEAMSNRTREIHWGPRTLDLDIIFYEKLIYEDQDLIIPHVDMENRYFVLKPLSEIAPNFRHPILQKTVTQLLNCLD